MEGNPTRLTFKYVYPQDLRDLYINGIYGGATPRAEIYAHMYSERHPIPKKVVHGVTDTGGLGPEEEIEKGGDIVRFIQASIVMDLKTAIAFRDWLDERIKFIETVNKEGNNAK